MPIAYIPRTRELYSEYPAYRWVVNESAPFAPLAKPIARSRLGLITSGGIYHRYQPRFRREDTTYRRIPKQAKAEELRIWHFGYLTRDAEADVNCVFPLERMREAEAEGLIGELADPAYSFMGGIYSARLVTEELAPRLVEELLRARVEALFLVPV